MMTRSDVRFGDDDDSEDGEDELGDTKVDDVDEGDDWAPTGHCLSFSRTWLLSEEGRDECGSQRLREFDCTNSPTKHRIQGQ